jgi:hypothetical protein
MNQLNSRTALKLTRPAQFPCVLAVVRKNPVRLQIQQDTVSLRNIVT